MIDLAFCGMVALVISAAVVVFRVARNDERDEQLTDRGGHVRTLRGDDQADEWMQQ